MKTNRDRLPREPAALRYPVRQPSLAAQTEQILADRLLSGEFGPGDQLPAEHELANEFRVSRATVRAAIAALVRRGLVVQRHGVGTFAAVGSRLTNDLAQATDLAELVSRRGTTSHVVFDEVEIRPATAETAQSLDLSPSDPVVVSAKRFVADDRTLVYVVNSIPVAILGSELADRVVAGPDMTEPLFGFLDIEVGLRPGPQLARIYAELGADIVHPHIDLDPATPVLRIEEVGYSVDNQPVWHSQTWFPPGAMNVELIRQPRSRVF